MLSYRKPRDLRGRWLAEEAENMSVIVAVRLRPWQYLAICRAAESCGKPVSVWIRTVCGQALAQSDLNS